MMYNYTLLHVQWTALGSKSGGGVTTAIPGGQTASSAALRVSLGTWVQAHRGGDAAVAHGLLDEPEIAGGGEEQGLHLLSCAAVCSGPQAGRRD